jgi:hypothetical protein
MKPKPNGINTGFAIRSQLKKNGQSIAWLARQLDCDPSNLRKQLNTAHLYSDLILHISIVLKKDFFAPYSHNIRNAIAEETQE